MTALDRDDLQVMRDQAGQAWVVNYSVAMLIAVAESDAAGLPTRGSDTGNDVIDRMAASARSKPSFGLTVKDLQLPLTGARVVIEVDGLRCAILERDDGALVAADCDYFDQIIGYVGPDAVMVQYGDVGGCIEFTRDGRTVAFLMPVVSRQRPQREAERGVPGMTGRPFSNGTEERAWQAVWCEFCEHDHDPSHDPAGNGTGCELLLAAIVPDLYPFPKEWTPEPPSLGRNLPSLMLCDRFKPCHIGACTGDPAAEERVEIIARVRTAWDADRKAGIA